MKFIHTSLALVLILAASIAASVAADEMSPKGRPHFEGKQAETYTLENALEMIRSELSDLAITLEEVHLGSERADTEIVLEAGRNYLSVTEQFDD